MTEQHQRRLEVLEAEQEALCAKLTLVREEMRSIHVALCRVKVGDVVRSKRDQAEYQVIEISNPKWGWAVGVPKRKDGTWGTARRNLYDNFEPINP